jgi:hypothetical protein
VGEERTIYPLYDSSKLKALILRKEIIIIRIIMPTKFDYNK